MNITKLVSSDYLFAITYAEPLPNWNNNPFLGLYNSQTEEWVYERKLMAQPTQNSSVYRPQIYNNKLYASVGKNLVCHDLATGEQLWTRSFTQDFFLSGFIIEEDKIIAYNENQTLYCLDPSSGQTIWENKEVRSSTPMNYLNGVVYLVGGNFYAVEVSTGKTLWNITAGSTGESSSNYFRPNAIYVLPAKDGNVAKVVALSNLYAYCFKAHQ